jgi:SAM-dependent methyltransferase
MEKKNNTQGYQKRKSLIESIYSRGDYFKDSRRHSGDAKFKANNFLRIFSQFTRQNNIVVKSYIDVGCGSGDVVKIIADYLKRKGSCFLKAKGYDISPHVQNIKNEGIEYIWGDFCESDEFVDLVTLFDVFEHIPDPIEFIRLVAQRCRILVLHIPLEYCLNIAMRDKFRSKLRNPGHLIFMDIASALNLLTLAGLRVLDYEYTFGFFAPSGHQTVLSKAAFPFRWLLAKINPWLLSKAIGGASLLVISMTSIGLKEIQLSNEYYK